MAQYSDCNHQNKIIRHIQDVTFDQLTLIGLAENEIYSIEQLSRIRMPKLSSLGLGNYQVI